jgi:hypothetical protein
MCRFIGNYFNYFKLENIIMNEKIKQIWLETMKEIDRDPVDYDEFLFASFAENIVLACANVVIDCDPSEKCIVHEPYRSIAEAVHYTLEPDEGESS